MPFSDLIGHEPVVRVLQGAIRGGKVAHAYLFLGPEGVGKTTTAHLFAKALNCERAEADCCDACESCRRADADNHPNLHLMTLAGGKERVSIEQVRALQHEVALKASGGGRRVFILPEAEKMSIQAANAVLKTLEEPPPSVTIILISANPSELLPTVYSRCQTIRFAPTTREQIRQALQERFSVPEEEARFLAAYSNGRPGIALRMARDSAALDHRSEMLSLLEQFARSDSIGAFRLAEGIRTLVPSSGGDDPEDEPDEESDGKRKKKGGSRAQIAASLDIAQAWFRDLLAIKESCDEEVILNADRMDSLREAASRFTADQIRRGIAAAAEAKHRIGRNANPQLALEVMACSIRG